MWPFDCFNEYSALMNEFDIDDSENKQRKVFVAKDYRENSREELIIKAIKKTIPNAEIIDRDSREAEEDIVRYGLIESMPKNSKKGDINLDILIKIIQARFFIADITPIILREKDKEDNKPILNHNVAFELGLACAWKMPEQVMIIYDADFDLGVYKLPFDIQGYFCQKINFGSLEKGIDELKDFIESRCEELDSKKSIIIKNIKKKIDGESLKLLNDQLGIPFPDYVTVSQKITKGNEIINQPVSVPTYSPSTIRHLMTLGILSVNIFPAGRTHIVCFTELGRFLLSKGLNIDPFPKMLADLYLVRYYKDTDQEIGKCKQFLVEHRVPYHKAHDELVKKYKEQGCQRPDNDIVQLYKEFMESGKSFQDFRKAIVNPWLGVCSLMQ